MFVITDEDKLREGRMKAMEDGKVVPALDLASFVQYYHFHREDAQEYVDVRIGEHAQRAKNHFAIKQLPACLDDGHFETIRSNETLLQFFV